MRVCASITIFNEICFLARSFSPFYLFRFFVSYINHLGVNGRNMFLSPFFFSRFILFRFFVSYTNNSGVNGRKTFLIYGFFRFFFW